jgi:alcohol dehydrogenase class IV
MGGEFQVPHGVANGMLLGPVMEYNVFSCPEKFAKIAEEMGEPTQGLGTKEAALLGVKAVQRLSREIEMPQRLSDLGIPEGALPRMAEEALKVARPLANNPRPVSREDAIRIYQGVF